MSVRGRQVRSKPRVEADAAGAALGIDLGGTRIKWVVSDGVTVHGSGESATPRSGAADTVAVLRRLIREHGGIPTGLAIPGPVPPPEGYLLLPNVPGEWGSIDLAEELGAGAARFIVVNDAIAFAVAEMQATARGYRDVAFLTLGTGVGGAIAIDGQVVRGARRRTGELGHTIVEPGGLLCVCGANGCLETVASAPAIVAAAVRYVISGASSLLRERCGDDPARLTAAAVAEVTRAGDPYAAAVFERAGRGIGRAIVNACAVFAPELVVVGGGLARALDLMRPGIDRALGERDHYMRSPRIVESSLAESAGSIGAAAAALGQD